MLFFKAIFLSISASIDALGIGITYGLRKIKLSNTVKFILFLVTFLSTAFSGILGIILKRFFNIATFDYIPSIILIIIGTIIIFKNKKDNTSYNEKNFYPISIKEAFVLGFTLSVDSLCIGIIAGTFGINILLFAFLSAFFHCSFLSIGNYIGNNLINLYFLSSNIYTKISGILLIIIGLFGLF